MSSESVCKVVCSAVKCYNNDSGIVITGIHVEYAILNISLQFCQVSGGERSGTLSTFWIVWFHTPEDIPYNISTHGPTITAKIACEDTDSDTCHAHISRIHTN